jgi:putative nucleotidyltransferase with HDIG domain
MRRDLTTFIQQRGNPPTLSAIYYELLQVVARPETSVVDLSDLILRDQSLTARILKLANSAFFGSAQAVDTMSDAIQLIGFREIQNLVLATAVIDAFVDVPSDLLDVKSFWMHSVACAVGSSILAEGQQELTPERLFIGGLLHDIGRLLMLLHAPAESREILDRCQREGQLSTKVEREVLGFDHAALGAELAWYWKLPRALVDIIEGHHAPPESSSAPLDTVLVHYADFVVTVLQLGNSGEFYVSPLLVPAQYEHLLPANEIDGFVGELEARCAELVPILLERA